MRTVFKESEVLARVFPVRGIRLVTTYGEIAFLSIPVSATSKTPNKSLEPTSPTVTPRAFETMIECPNWRARSIPARVAPAVLVAHL